MGLLDEIVIPPNKDWRGEHYGFVRFLKVENVRLLETKLDNLRLDGKKLKVNVSKIARKRQGTMFKQASSKSKGICKESAEEKGKGTDVRGGGIHVHGKSYAAMLRNSKEEEWKSGDQRKAIYVSKSFFYTSSP